MQSGVWCEVRERAFEEVIMKPSPERQEGAIYVKLSGKSVLGKGSCKFESEAGKEVRLGVGLGRSKEPT